MLTKALAGASLALAFAMAPAFADDVTVHLLHVNQTGDPFWKQVAEDYNASHPGVKVVVDYMENEAYKAKLPTLLQSDDRPDIIYSWAGGVMRAQIEAGYIKDISEAKAGLRQGGLSGAAQRLRRRRQALRHPHAAFRRVDHLQQGAARQGGRRPGVDGDLGRLPRRGEEDQGRGHHAAHHGRRRQMADALRLVVPADAHRRRRRADDGGDHQGRLPGADPSSTPGRSSRSLPTSNPFQDGWLGTKYLPSQGMFGDGKGAMAIQLNGFIPGQQQNATDGKGIPDDKIGLALFPTVPGGKGKITDVFGGVQGFLVTKDAPPEAIDFLKFFATAEEQKAAAAGRRLRAGGQGH